MSSLGKVLAIAGGVAIAAGVVWWLFKEQIITPPTVPPTVPEFHYECIKEPAYGNLIMCGQVDGKGVDKCDPFASPDFCWGKVPCSSHAECGLDARCWDSKCYWTATKDNIQRLDYDGDVVPSVRFTFPKRVVGNKILGDIGFKLNPWAYGCDPYVKIHVIRDGKRIKTVYDNKHIGLPTTLNNSFSRTDIFATSMAEQAVDGIEFECRCEMGFPVFGHCNVLNKVHAQLIFF